MTDIELMQVVASEQDGKLVANSFFPLEVGPRPGAHWKNGAPVPITVLEMATAEQYEDQRLRCERISGLPKIYPPPMSLYWIKALD